MLGALFHFVQLGTEMTIFQSESNFFIVSNIYFFRTNGWFNFKYSKCVTDLTLVTVTYGAGYLNSQVFHFENKR